jgi:DNA-binding transcriptional regulator YiaG
MTVKELRTLSGMTQKAFAEYFGFSKRAVENWEGGKRECPEYLLKLIRYKLENEAIIKKGEQS